jgi:DNA-binding transcriptional LysR family regulator
MQNDDSTTDARTERLRHALVSRLKLRHMALLRAVQQYRTLSRVALEMQLSQPGVTKALKEIEDIFMAPLFVRSAGGLVPTPSGEAVLHYALASLADMEATSKALTAIDSGMTGRVRIGVTPQLPQALLAAALGHLLAQSPKVAISIEEGLTDDLVATLREHQLDCVIGRSFHGQPDSEITQEALYQEAPCILVHAASKERLSRAPRADWSRLATLDWILPPGHTPTRRTLNAIFLAGGVQPPLPRVETYSVKNMATVLSREPNAITILARDIALEIASTGVADVLPYQLSWGMPPISLFVSRASAKQSVVRELAACIRQAAAQLNACKAI